jgi:hypothetical protein
MVFSPKGNGFSTHHYFFHPGPLAHVTIKVYNMAIQLVEWVAQQ